MDIDTVRVPVLQLNPVEPPPQGRPTDADPYNQLEPRARLPRRSLDDMRRLSAAIKRNRACQSS